MAKTNADRIREMSIEEPAEGMSCSYDDATWDFCRRKNCKECTKEWLEMDKANTLRWILEVSITLMPLIAYGVCRMAGKSDDMAEDYWNKHWSKEEKDNERQK